MAGQELCAEERKASLYILKEACLFALLAIHFASPLHCKTFFLPLAVSVLPCAFCKPLTDTATSKVQLGHRPAPPDYIRPAPPLASKLASSSLAILHFTGVASGFPTTAMGLSQSDSIDALPTPAAEQFDQLFDDYVCSDNFDLDALSSSAEAGASDDLAMPSVCGPMLESILSADAGADKPLQESTDFLTSSGLEDSPYSIYRKLATQAAISDAELLSLEGRPAQIRPSIPRIAPSTSHRSSRSQHHNRHSSHSTFHHQRTPIDARRKHRHHKSSRLSARAMQAMNPLYGESIENWTRRIEMQQNVCPMPLSPPPSNKSSSVEEDPNSMFMRRLGSQSHTVSSKDTFSPPLTFSEASRCSSEVFSQSRRPTIVRYASAPQDIPSSPHDSPTHSHQSWTPDQASDAVDLDFAFSASPPSDTNSWWSSNTPALQFFDAQPQSQPCTPASTYTAYHTGSRNLGHPTATANRGSRSSFHGQGLMIDFDNSPHPTHHQPNHSQRSSIASRPNSFNFDLPYSTSSSYASFDQAEPSRHVQPLSPSSRSPVTSSSSRRASKHSRNSSINNNTISSRRKSNSQASQPNRRSMGSKSSGSSKAAPAGACSFVNYTPDDSSKILTGVAPSGSSKTKMRREREAREAQKKFQALTIKAAQEGTLEALIASGEAPRSAVAEHLLNGLVA